MGTYDFYNHLQYRKSNILNIQMLSETLTHMSAVVHTSDPSTQKAEVSRSLKSRAILVYTDPG